MFRFVTYYPQIIILMKQLLFIIFIITGLQATAQQEIPADSLYRPDPYYLEDQLYFGISYIVLRDLPENMSQNGFSNAVRLGFIRDIPINERRNFGFGLGLGLSWENYYQNLRISVDEQTGNIEYQLLINESFRSNSFQVNKIDIPLEIRWRGSTPEKYKFWRLYAGIIASYVYKKSANFVTNKVDVTYNKINIIKSWQFGANLSAGYGTWNFTFYYGLSPMMKNDLNLDGESFNIKNMQFGFIYYFL